jgi:hypothetical protein
MIMELKKKLVLAIAIIGLGIASSQAQTETVATINGKKITFNPNAIITANNGLTAASGNVQFGGALTKASVLTTTSAYTLALLGLQPGGSGDKIIVADGNGVLKLVDQSSVKGVGDNLGNHIATTDLNMSGKNITNINIGNFKFDIQIADRMAANTNFFSFYKYEGNFNIWNTKNSRNELTIDETSGKTTLTSAQIGSTSITNSLTVSASKDPLKLIGIANAAPNDFNLMMKEDGTVVKGVSSSVVPTDTGSVIAIDGKLIVAQEITCLMSADFIMAAGGGVYPIGNITNKIIDNKNKFSGSSTANSFSVVDTGTYMITMNLQVTAVSPATPAFGIYDVTLGAWVARVNDWYIGNNATQTFTLITSVILDQTHTYSFYAGGPTSPMAIRAFSYGNSGSGPVSFFSVKRLR